MASNTASLIGEDIVRLIFESLDFFPPANSPRPLTVDVHDIRQRNAFFFNCTLTNRLFSQYSLPFLYRIIAVDQLSSQRKLAILELLREPLKKHGHYVWWFTTGGVGLGGFDVVRELLPFLPNVKVLNVCRTLSGLQGILRSAKFVERLAFGIECDADRANLINRVKPNRLIQPRLALSTCTTLELDWTVIDAQIFKILDMFPNVKYLTFGSSCKFRTEFLPASDAELQEELEIAESVLCKLDRLTFGMILSEKLHMLLPLCGNLKAIDIRFVRLISKDSIRLLTAHCQNLVEFSFYTSSIDKEAIEELILRPPKRLQSLSMKYLSYNVTGTLLEMVSARPSVTSHDLNSISLFGMVPPSLDALCALSILLPNIRHLGFIMKVDYTARELGRALAGFKHLASLHIRRPLFFESSVDPESAERHEQLISELADLLPNVGHIKCFELALTRTRYGDSKSVTKTLQMEAK